MGFLALLVYGDPHTGVQHFMKCSRTVRREHRMLIATHELKERGRKVPDFGVEQHSCMLIWSSSPPSDWLIGPFPGRASL
jgi:hypothetical protein